MASPLTVHVDTSGLIPWGEMTKGRAVAVARMAGRDASRAMKAEASRQIRARKELKVKYVSDVLSLIRPTGNSNSGGTWGVRAKWKALPLSVFPYKQTRLAGRDEVTGQFARGRKVKGGRGGVYVAITGGKRKLFRGAFVAKMKSGHVGIFRRKGRTRLPIRQMFTGTVADTVRDSAPAIADTGRGTFVSTFNRLKSGTFKRYAARYNSIYE